MKHKKSKQNTDEPMGCVARPPWEVAKTKRAAYFAGERSGRTDGRNDAERELKQKSLALDERKVQLDALKNITQAGSDIITAMSKAYLSFNRDL